MSAQGKTGIMSKDRTRSGNRAPTAPAAAAQATATTTASDAPADKGDCGCGCNGKRAARPQAAAAGSQTTSRAAVARRAPVAMSTGRAASVARRKALSSRGKSGVGKNGLSAAQTARASNPNLSGRELAQALRAQRSRTGSTGKKSTECSGQRRQRKPAGETGPAEDASWKVGASETGEGQVVTGTMVGRSRSVTGDEPSTCRAVTGTEYLGADIFREFCQAEPQGRPRKVNVSPTGHGNAMTGTRVGRSVSVTGDEPGTCKRVTGTEYVGADQSQAFCGTSFEAGPSKITGAETRKGKTVTGNNVGRSTRVTGDEPGAQRELTGTQYMQLGDNTAPPKVGQSSTLRSGMVSGTMVGRSQHVTGDEPGSCKNITGDDYVGREQYGDFCEAIPAPTDVKSSVSTTMTGEKVTGTMTGRSGKVTGDEPGTCKAITGTPYASSEQYEAYCPPEQASGAAARMQASKRMAGAVMTGQQPAIGGTMTGDSKGACETVSGTPYVGADQVAQACPARPAEPHSPDFPQPMTGAPWQQFSVESPGHASQSETVHGEITGSTYEKGHITGPFGMASGKITGTEEARFGVAGANRQAPQPVQAGEEERVRSRITGEGMDAGLRITGDDWDRGSNVTGTEGTSATVRNPTRAGGSMSAMAALRVNRRNEDLPEPVSPVTGSSGSTEKGALVTYSGGARG